MAVEQALLVAEEIERRLRAADRPVPGEVGAPGVAEGGPMRPVFAVTMVAVCGAFATARAEEPASAPARSAEVVAGNSAFALDLYREIVAPRKSVRERVVGIVAALMGAAPERLSEETSFVNDLGADDLDAVELVMEYEDEFDVSIPDTDADRLATIGDVVRYLGPRVPGNVVFSPLAVSCAFALVRQGARGATAAEIDRVLHLPQDPGPAFRGLLHGLGVMARAPGGPSPRPRSFEWLLASGLFHGTDVAVRDEFRRAAADFGGETTAVDFSEVNVAGEILSRWLHDRAGGRAGDFAGPGPGPRPGLILLNLSLFRASWLDPFPQDGTRIGTFRAPTGVVSASMMRRAGRFRYAETPDAQVIELPHEGGDTATFIVLPKAADGLPALERTLTKEALDRFLAALSQTEVDVIIPRWTSARVPYMHEPMRALGLVDVFAAARADLSGFAPKPGLSLALGHRASLAVDEVGHTPAAPGATEVRATPLRPAEGKAFVADRPFLYGVRHLPTSSILFLGRLADPTH
jgi:serpin B